MTLNLFYAEPDEDRWLPYDRYPRRIVRRVVRGKPRPGGQMRVFLNLRAGLDRIGVAYRINDYRYVSAHPEELACIIGKPFLLDTVAWRNPILFGAAVYSHPSDDPMLLSRLDIRKILVPGQWMESMCKPMWGDRVKAWPVGIDTDVWAPSSVDRKDVDVLIYDKVHWEYERSMAELIEPISRQLRAEGRSYIVIRYGSYREEDYQSALKRCRSMIFLCEHETQGIAYQEALSCGVPIFAWDRGGPWRDPAYYPDRVIFEPVSSVPYWDGACGMKFESFDDFRSKWSEFWQKTSSGQYHPRDYILENLTLEKCATEYLTIAQSVSESGILE